MINCITDEIDFWDDDACKLKNILSFEPTTSGLQIFQNNKIYQLVKGKHNDDEMKIEDNKNTSTSKTPKGDKKKNSNTKINLSK
ncbi:hypothetical protein HCN44_005061 [Aphidius gifuensis]|uniref:Uncharacterized protein n=1 Tax=Aphidius gifuensis TaxID=684658 RepID=A0A835CQY2_APHGI|nr:hypothetical protein HCN44_005061 [Aphidius gifuensis]